MTGETHCISSLSAVGSGEVRGQVEVIKLIVQMVAALSARVRIKGDVLSD